METGTLIGGFRIDRRLGSGSFGTVYEATQASIGRTVALRLIDRRLLAEPGVEARFLTQQRLCASLHHPNLIQIYEAGTWEGGSFVAVRFVRGRTLAQLHAAGAVTPEIAGSVIERVSSALAAAHAAGLVHGAVSAENVLVDEAGTPFLADLGLGREGSPAGDLADLERLRTQLGQRDRRRRPSRVLVAALALGGLIALGVGVLVGATAGDGGASDAQPDPPAAGADVLGSDLAPGPSAELGCAPDPGPNTPACTFTQEAPAATVTVRRAGSIRRWSVRGALGDVTLQVAGRSGRREVLAGFSQAELVPDLGPHTFQTDIPVERGDRIGVLLAPGAVIGTRPGEDGAATLKWPGSLPFAPEVRTSERLDLELLVRAEIEPGAPRELDPVTGAQATGEASVLARQAMTARGGAAIHVAVVDVDGTIAIDVVGGPGRRSRFEVPDADPAGTLLALEVDCGFRHGFCFRWQNDDEPLPVVHAYRLTGAGDGLAPIG